MKNTLKPKSSILNPQFSILALIFGLILGVLTVPAVAQTTNAVASGVASENLVAPSTLIASGGSPPQPSTAANAAGLEDTIATFALTHPWVIGLLSVIGALRLGIKPLMTGIRYYVESTATDADDVFLDKIEHSFLYTAFLFSLDWLTSIKLKARSADAPLNKALSAFAIIALLSSILVLGQGCKPLDPSGVYHGNEVLHKSELITTTSYEVIHTYVTWEQENRAALAKYPEIKQSADAMRANAKQWFATANALHDAYAANPTTENGAALNTALAVLQTALNEAVKYMSQAATSGGASGPASLVH